ncbi:MAG: FAD-binding oxidoreductase [Pseudomonadota bacterium]
MSDALMEVLSGIDRLEGAEVSARATSYWDASPMEAEAIYLPRSTADVSRILAACNDAGRKVVVHGGRTGCADGVASNAGDIVLSLEKMNAIEEIDPIGHVAVVEAGVILETLQDAVADAGLFLPMDLGARGSCTIGGNIATNAGGVNVIRYGMMRNLVLGLEVVLPDGRVLSSMKRMLKDNAGYDLKQLFIGSEGTLGVVTRAIVKLEPAVSQRETALAALSSYADVTALLSLAKARLGAALTSFELMWGDYYRAVCDGLGLRAPLDRAHPFYVLIETEANAQGANSEAFMALLEEAMTSSVVKDGVIAQSEQERREIWRIRDDFEPILREKPVYLFDVSMPVTDMDGYIDKVRRALTVLADDAVLHVFGHIGDGNLHLFAHPGKGAAAAPERRRAVEECVYEPLRHIEGSVSAEHGIGREKKEWLSVSRSEDEIAMMKMLKKSIDPNNILNPGVVFDL